MMRQQLDGYATRPLLAAIALAIGAILLVFAGPARAWADGVTVLDSSGTAIAAATVGADADSPVTVSKDADAATLVGCSFGIDSFTRYNKGTNREVGGSYIGYRYPMEAQDAFCVITTEDCLIVYVPAAVAETLGLDLSDSRFQENFLSLYKSLDTAASMGGQTYERLALPAYFTSDDRVSIGDYIPVGPT